jgi:hypothetical protein
LVLTAALVIDPPTTATVDSIFGSRLPDHTQLIVRMNPNLLAHKENLFGRLSKKWSLGADCDGHFSVTIHPDRGKSSDPRPLTT